VTTKSHQPKSSKGKDKKGGAKVTGGGHVTATGREVWRVVRDGREEILVTTNTSAKVMDEAMKIYADALKRLAKR